MALYKYHYIELDTKRSPRISLQNIVAGETGNRLWITVTNNGETVDMSEKENGEYIYRVCLVIKSNLGVRRQDSATEDSGISFIDANTGDHGKVNILLSKDSFTAGKNRARIEIYSKRVEEDDTLIVSAEWTFDVDGADEGDNVGLATPLLVKYEQRAKSWATGGTGMREGEDTDNAAFYAQIARDLFDHQVVEPSVLAWLAANFGVIKAYVGGIANAWLDEHITNPSNPPLDASLTLDNAAAPASVVGGIASTVRDISDLVIGKNLFDKNNYNIINAGISSSTNKLAGNNALRTIYVPCKANTTYTVSKSKDGTSYNRFVVGFTDESVVANNITCTGVVFNNNAAYLTSTSGSLSKYILVTCYHTNATMTLSQILASIQIEEGSEPTEYQEYVAPYYVAVDYEARSKADTVSDRVDRLKSEYVADLVNFSNRFEKLADTFVDDFIDRESFVDTDHPYTRYGASIEPTISTGVGATIENSASEVVFAREFNDFPIMITVGRMKDVKMGIALYATDYSGKYITIDTYGIVRYDNVSLGYLDEMSEWVFVVVTQDGVTLYDDSGNRIDVPLTYAPSYPKNYGIYFGKDRATYGITSLIEWEYKPLDSFDVNRAIVMKNTPHERHMMNTMRYSRSYIDNGTRITTTDPGDDYIKVLDAEDDDDVIMHTNNPILRFIMDWSDNNTYRSEAGFRTDLVHDGKLTRHKFQADFMIPRDGNVENPVGNSYATDIIQVHDNMFAAAGWTDPPPVAVFYENGKLYASVRYIETGEVPSSSSVITLHTYYLYDVPYDEWFTLAYEVRPGYLPGLDPHLVIWINGSEKLRVYTPVGYNIIHDGGWTRCTFGLYAPGLAYGTYAHTYRKLYVTNVKYRY